MRRGRAVQFNSELRDGGRSRPLLIEVELDDGSYVDVVVKLACDDGTLGPARLIRECAAAALAERLGLPVPERFVVEICSTFIQSLALVSTELADRLTKHISLAGVDAFGSTYLHGFGVVAPKTRLPEGMLQCAAEIFAFDALSLNRDRCVPSVGNPNCLTDGRQMMMIDHEQALDAQFLMENRSNAPWVPGALNEMRSMLEHIFLHALEGKPINLDRLQAAWEAVDDDALSALLTGVSTAWDVSGDQRASIRSYLNELSQHLPEAFGEVRRVLA